MTRRLAILIFGVVGFWLMTALPAWGLGLGDGTLPYSAIACVICLIPAAATFLWAELGHRGQPNAQMAVFMAGTAVRMIFVGGAASLLYLKIPAFRQHDGFLIWVAIYYLFVLFLETALIAASRSPSRAA